METTACTCGCACDCCRPNRKEITPVRAEEGFIAATVSGTVRVEQHAELCGCGCEGSGCT